MSAYEDHRRAVLEMDKRLAVEREVRRDKAEADLAAIRAALSAYHSALTNREHGGVAAGRALDAIQGILNMHWTSP